MSTDPVPWITPTKHDQPLPAKPTEAEQTGVNPDALFRLLLADHLRETIADGAAKSPRSLQVSIGASEIGGECHRQVAYRIAGTPPVNFGKKNDPIAPIVGIGTHAALADIMTRVDGGTGRYLIEEKVVYRGVPGTLDLYDRRRRLVVDWKSGPRAKVSSIKRDGPPKKYVVQAMIYAAALIERGDPVDNIAIVWITTNGTLDDIYVWTAPFDKAMADTAIDEFQTIATSVEGKSPDDVKPTPTRLCPWCAHWLPGSTDTRRGCPDGTEEGTK